MGRPSSKSSIEKCCSSANDGVQRSEQHVGSDQKISPTRSSIVSQFLDKLSPNEYKCKLCSKTYRCGTGTNVNIRRHLAKLMGKRICTLKAKCCATLIRSLQRKNGGSMKLPSKPLFWILVYLETFLQVAMPGYKGPTARTVQRNLKTQYNIKKEAMIQQLKNIQHISITTDTWCSGRKRHYLCITAHFVSSDYEQRGTILSFRQFHGRSFAMRLRRHVRTVLAMYGLDNGKIYATTTDNGTDIRKATQQMSVFGVRLHHITHGLNLVVQMSLNLCPKVKRTTCKTSSSSSAAKSEANDEESTADRPSNHNSTGEQSSQEDSDGVQDLDSADDWSDLDDEEVVALGLQYVGVLMTKCRKFIVTIRKSSILNDALLKLARDVVSVELVQNMKIRWNSTYKMIQRLLLYQNVLGTFYDNLDTIDGVTVGQRKKLIESKLATTLPCGYLCEGSNPNQRKLQ
ncbi:unnamed protein product [Adineta ricciae]|uniref:BED-type domain-containing protein n=1 Tax=Adineta ricciae TaxID=249248 RepID=A0A815P205_ADIRI|nr:unnamed protein product [Adineta ricciae]